MHFKLKRARRPFFFALSAFRSAFAAARMKKNVPMQKRTGHLLSYFTVQRHDVVALHSSSSQLRRLHEYANPHAARRRLAPMSPMRRFTVSGQMLPSALPPLRRRPFSEKRRATVALCHSPTFRGSLRRNAPIAHAAPAPYPLNSKARRRDGLGAPTALPMWGKVRGAHPAGRPGRLPGSSQNVVSPCSKAC